MIGEQSWRKDVFRDEFVKGKIGILIDTCYTPDTGQWETAIQRGKERMIIVEMYGNNRIKAKKGHENWVRELKKDSKMELKSCMSAGEWFFGDY